MIRTARLSRPAKALVLAAVGCLVIATAAFVAGNAGAASTLPSQGRPAAASATESAPFPASAAVDGNAGTRWSSAFSDPQWIRIGLGSAPSLCEVVLTWEAAYATGFQLQVSADATNWTSIYSTTTGTGGAR